MEWSTVYYYIKLAILKSLWNGTDEVYVSHLMISNWTQTLRQNHIGVRDEFRIFFFSIACTKIKWLCPIITWFFARKIAIWNILGGLQPPSPTGRTPMDRTSEQHNLIMCVFVKHSYFAPDTKMNFNVAILTKQGGFDEQWMPSPNLTIHSLRRWIKWNHFRGWR